MRNISNSLVFLFAVTCVTACAQIPIGTWNSAASLPQARAEHAVTEANGKVYAIAGGVLKVDGSDKQGTGASTLVEEYDPATDKWRVRSPLPRALTHVGVATLDGKIYAIGGFVADIHKEAQTDVFMYDPATDQWTTLPSLSSPRGSVGAVALNGKIHAIGGRDPQDLLKGTHEIFDPAKQVWTTAAELPIARDHLSTVVADGKIHVIGGRTGDLNNVTAHHHVYDSDSDTWSEAPPLPTPRSAMATTLYQNMIIVFGGECHNEKTYTENEGYDLSAKKWINLASVEGRHGFGAATVGERAYFVAGAKGCGGDGLSKQLLVFTFPQAKD